MIGIVGARFLGENANDHFLAGVGRLRQHDIPEIGDRSRIENIVVVDVARDAIRFFRESGRDIVLAVENRYIRPGIETDRREVVGLGFRIVVDDSARLASALAFDDLQHLAIQLDRIRIGRVTRYGDDKLVGKAFPNAWQTIVRIELAVADFR